ncbi:MAG: FAD-dependent oxidoreductase [Nitrospira sp.]|nr:FAD-dependent oxidoreductase [Nitrospira sp.]MCP9462597.1 FAD-dependent oxidoreductase [Nitrospira sp.]MCP9475918.1 FAD-dependent oxidoreductase [Nitrospira sp.]
MARTASFRSFSRLMAAALFADRQRCSAEEAIELLREATRTSGAADITRRTFLKGAAATGATLALGSLTGFPFRLEAKPLPSSLSVGIVGAGLAGLTCADRLKVVGIRASVYEASARAGGRCWSLRGVFPSQVAERGGELIDTLHTTMLGYARRFGLELEDLKKEPGETSYFFHGQRRTEDEIVGEFRDFVPVMQRDLHRLSKEVTALAHTEADAILDRTSLLAYLEGQNGSATPAGPLAKAALVAAYEAEYGLAASEQSCLNLLLFIHPDRRSDFTPFGVFSDERYHLMDGNDRIVEALARELDGQVVYGARLIRVRRASDSRLELTLVSGSRTVVKTHDVVVLAIPFTILREVELDENLAIPSRQLAAIRELGYGTNAKMMVGFSARPWRTLGSSGASYADLPHVQTTWETNPARGSEARGILTDYSSGPRGINLIPSDVQTEARRFLNDLEKVYPGVLSASTLSQGRHLAHLEHWPSHPLVQGSYTCYKPGQFTTIAGLEGIPVGNLFFAGEHTNSFYEWQGFMEGAALSGIAAAQAIAALVKRH